jgi:putative FmdB family regulatory protein
MPVERKPEENPQVPIYEFYCPDCHTLFNFLARTVNTTKRPLCPRCRKRRLSRQVSLFAHLSQGGEREMEDDLPFDESKMERAMESLAREAEHLDEDDPRQAARIMKKLARETGIEYGDTMSEALQRMEAGEDPEAIEAELGDALEEDEPFLASGEKGRASGNRRRTRAPDRDETLYDH